MFSYYSAVLNPNFNIHMTSFIIPQILTQIHNWGLTRDLELYYRRCLRNVYEFGSYTKRDKLVLKAIREHYIEIQREKFNKQNV